MCFGDPIQAVPRLTETKPKYRNETEIPERNIKIIGKHIQVYRCDVDLAKRPLKGDNIPNNKYMARIWGKRSTVIHCLTDCDATNVPMC